MESTRSRWGLGVAGTVQREQLTTPVGSSLVGGESGANVLGPHGGHELPASTVGKKGEGQPSS